VTRDEIVVLASRTLAVLMLVWALSEVSYLPGSINAFRHYVSVELTSPSATQYYRQANLISLSFLVVRVIGYSLLARWLFKCGPDVADLLLPRATNEIPVAINSAKSEERDIR